jgi:Ca2+-binding RTX toxin-like protein
MRDALRSAPASVSPDVGSHLRNSHLGLLLVLAAVVACLAPSGASASGAVEAVEADGVREYWTAERMRGADPVPVPEPTPLAAGNSAEDGNAQALAGVPTLVEPLQPGSQKAPEVEQQQLSGAAADAEAARASYSRTEVTDPAAENVRMHGKVFFSVEAGSQPGDYVCSGTALNSNNGSIVWTAGHCVWDTFGGGYATNWLFVPAYSGDGSPFGEWPAEELSSPSQWRSDADSSYDFSAARVSENGAGQSLTEVVGGRGIGFNQGRDHQYSSYGYPAKPPPIEFAAGNREFQCDSPLGGTDNPPGSGPNTNWIGCDMTGGSSGGGWISGGTLLSVNSYSYCDITGTICEERLYGPYLDDTAKQLYEEISGAATYCQDKKVTIVGTGAADKLVGTDGKDVIAALGGKDSVNGKGGKDIVCGGGGADTLSGKGGKDQLSGDGGDDKLKGGDGKDTCNGGKGKDSAKSCETKKKIP